MWEHIPNNILSIMKYKTITQELDIKILACNNTQYAQSEKYSKANLGYTASFIFRPAWTTESYPALNNTPLS